MKRIVLLGALLVGCSGATESSGSPPTFPEGALTTLHSDQGALTVEVRTAPDQPPSRGVISVEYRITGADGRPVDGLTLSPVPWMPVMGHGSSVVPVVTPEGGGRYTISNVELFMPGAWELRTTISGAAEDRATPAFEIP
jgi:hypothetical protein